MYRWLVVDYKSGAPRLCRSGFVTDQSGMLPDPPKIELWDQPGSAQPDSAQADMFDRVSQLAVDVGFECGTRSGISEGDVFKLRESLEALDEELKELKAGGAWIEPACQSGSDADGILTCVEPGAKLDYSHDLLGDVVIDTDGDGTDNQLLPM